MRECAEILLSAICSHHEYTSTLEVVWSAHSAQGAKLVPNAPRLAVVNQDCEAWNPRWDPPPPSFPAVLSAHYPHCVLSCTLCISFNSAQRDFQTCTNGEKKNKHLYTCKHYVILPAWLAQKVGCPLLCYLSSGWTEGFVKVWVTCRFPDYVPHPLPANWPPISGPIKQAKLKVTK